MAIRKIVQVGNPIIRRKSKRVKKINTKAIRKVIGDMIATMRRNNLVGIAAPQVGKNLRIYLTEIRPTKFRNRKKADPLRVFINPRVRKLSRQTQSGYEGCGSVAVANLFGKVPRSKSLTVEAYDKKGKFFVFEAKGLVAIVIQHEHDHIEGKVFLDRLKDTKTLMSRNEYLKMVK